MAGHSKWANIKHKKGAEDAKRGKIFQKISKEIAIAIKEGGIDPDTNPRLRLSIEKAKSANMPNDNIKRLLNKSNKDTSTWNEITYEGYGPGGIAIIVECLTDNINRTSASVKANFTKGNGNLGVNGSVSYLFDEKGIIVLDSTIYSLDTIIELALQVDILDIKESGEFIIVESIPSNLVSIKMFFENNGIVEFISTEVSKIALSEIEIDEKKQEQLERLVDLLEDNDDVQAVHTNAK